MLQYQFLHFTDSCGFLILARHRNRLINRTTQSKYVMKRHSQIQLSLRPGGQYYYVRKFRHSNQFIVETCRTKGIRGCGWALRMGVFGTSRLTQRTTPCRSVGGCRRASLAIGSRCFRCHTYVGSRRQQKKVTCPPRYVPVKRSAGTRYRREPYEMIPEEQAQTYCLVYTSLECNKRSI